MQIQFSLVQFLHIATPYCHHHKILLDNPAGGFVWGGPIAVEFTRNQSIVTVGCLLK